MNLDTTYSKLCQTLYKLSHWEQPEKYTPVDTLGDKRWPAYTTGYLLEKLPRGVKGNHLIMDYRYERGEETVRFAYCKRDRYIDVNEEVIAGIADTPRAALLKLAIRMFEDGVLVAEDKA